MTAHDPPRYTINRKLVLVLPRQPFVDWIQTAVPADPPPTIEQVRDDADVFLIPDKDVESFEDARKWVERRWSMFFEQALYDWCTDESAWPAKRTLALFRTWFDITFHSMVWDLSDDPVQHEDWEDDEFDPTVH